MSLRWREEPTVSHSWIYKSVLLCVCVIVLEDYKMQFSGEICMNSGSSDENTTCNDVELNELLNSVTH